MGHQHYSTTIDIYTHVTETMYEEEIGKFGMAVEESDEDMLLDDIDEGEDEEQGFGLMM